MTKYTDEQIIEYLRTLRKGDVLTAVDGVHDDFTTGKRYTIEADEDDDLYVTDDSDYDRYVSVSGNFEYSVRRLLVGGVFEIPSPANATPETFYASIRQIIEIGSYRSVTVRVDDAGFAELEALEHRSVKSRELAGLYKQRDAIQAEIVALEAE